MDSAISTCYRHDDRSAAVGCQRCGKPICAACMIQASVGHHCPECVAGHSSHTLTAQQLTNPQRGRLTVGVVVACCVLFFGQALLGGAGGGFNLTEEFLVFGPDVAGGRYWQLLTSGFVHGGFLHLGFNMFLLWYVGNQVEPQIGSLRTGLLYFTSLFAASAFVLLFNFTAPTLGASGAVLGMFGAVGGLLVARGGSLREYEGTMLLVLNLGLPLVIPGISFWGHFGGAVGGFISGWMLGKLYQADVSTGTVNLTLAGGLLAWIGAGLVAAQIGGASLLG